MIKTICDGCGSEIKNNIEIGSHFQYAERVTISLDSPLSPVSEDYCDKCTLEIKKTTKELRSKK